MEQTYPVVIRRTEEFKLWLARLRDARTKLIIQKRLLRLQNGNFGDTKTVGDGIAELRVDYGPGYRLYYTKIGKTVVLLLCGGDKSGQTKDIERAKRLAAEFRGPHE